MAKMWTFSYKFKTSLTFVLNFTFVKTFRSLIIIKLVSLTVLFFFMLISILALIKILLFSLLITISHAMVEKLLDYDYNIFTFFCVLPFEVHVKLGFKLDDRLNVSSFINSKTIGGIGVLGTKGW